MWLLVRVPRQTDFLFKVQKKNIDECFSPKSSTQEAFEDQLPAYRAKSLYVVLQWAWLCLPMSLDRQANVCLLCTGPNHEAEEVLWVLMLHSALQVNDTSSVLMNSVGTVLPQDLSHIKGFANPFN